MLEHEIGELMTLEGLMQLRYRLGFSRDAFLRAIGAIYAAAFASIAGLYGVDGLEPVDVFLHRLKQRNSQLQSASPLARIGMYPTAVWLHEDLQWSPSFAMQVLALVGLTTSLLIMCSAKWRATLPLALVWFSYLSIAQCGQTFMQFQWDSFLLEVGFLAIWIAPWWQTSSATFETPASVVWALRFLFFKFMLMSGAVKIQSECPTWLGLTALEYHFATQPLPLPLAWHAHQLPPIFLRLGVAATLLFEGPWTFFILAPSLPLRQFSAAMQILLQILIMLTGNYNFFNLLTIVMAMAMLDVKTLELAEDIQTECTTRQGTLARFFDNADKTWQCFQLDGRAKCVTLLLACVYSVHTFMEVFACGCDSSFFNNGHWEEFFVSCWIRFKPTVAETQAWIARVLPPSFILGAIVTGVAAMWQLLKLLIAKSPANLPLRRFRVVSTAYLLLSAFVTSWVLCSSVLTFAILDRPMQHSLPPFVYDAYHATSHWRIASAYGLFRTMTGVGTYEVGGEHFAVVARPEIIIEGTEDGGATWKPFEFLYKPGSVARKPKLNVPFQPRLDWQMWFAALGDYQGAPWIVHLIDKLLQGSPNVKALLDTSRDPFPSEPPQAIRAQLYYFDFTRLNLTWNRALPTASIVNNTASAPWWSRTFHSDYIPALEQGNPSIAQFVSHHFGRDPTSKIQLFDCDVRSWACHTLQYLVTWPSVSSVILASVALLIGQAVCSSIQSVSISFPITQRPKSKLE